MSAGQIAALIAAGAFVLLVLLLAVPLIKLGRTLDEATLAIRKTHEGADPLLAGANTAISRVNTAISQVNTQLEQVDGITSNARAITGNVSALSSVFTATLGGPLVKAAALSYGVSKAIRRRRGGRASRSSRRRNGRRW